MKFAALVRASWREGRGARGRLALLLGGIAVGVAAVVAVAGIGGGLRQAVFVESRTLLAADVALRSRQAWPEGLDELLAQTPELRRADLLELPTVVARGGETPAGTTAPSRLVELKVVDGAYPLRGRLTLEPDRPLVELLADGGAVIGPELGEGLGLALGDLLTVGEQNFEVRGFVLSEPDRTNFALALGPRVFLDHAGFADTGLDQFGSRIQRAVLLALGDTAGPEDARALGRRLRRGLETQTSVRVSTWADGQPGLRRAIEQTEAFLGLAGLLALVLGAVAAGLATRSWLESRVDALALYKCLGFERRHLFAFAFGQLTLLALIGGVLGAALGIGLQGLALHLSADLLPGDLAVPLVQPRPLLLGLALGLAAAWLSSLAPLAAATRVAPLVALRREAAPLALPRPLALGAAGLGLAGLYGAGLWLSGSALLAGLFTGGLFATALLLGALAWLLVRGARRLPRRLVPLPVRFGLASLARPNGPARVAMTALGLGVLVVASVQLVERRISGELAGALPEGAPSAFLIDVQPDQWEDLSEALAELGARDVRSAPMVVARLRAVDGREVSDLLAERRSPRRAQDGPAGEAPAGGGAWVLTREQRMTYGPELPPDNRLVAGALWSDPERAEVSVEEGYAENLGVSLGSSLTLDVQGVPIELLVTSIRSVQWESLGINFFLHVEPGVLEAAPQVRLATVRLEAGSTGAVQDRLRAHFPNITLIDVAELRERIATLVGRLARGVRALGLGCLAAGLFVLGAAITAAGRERVREAGLLASLGAVRRQVLVGLASEYALLGAVSGFVGGAAAAALAQAIAHFALRLEGAPEWTAPLWSALALALLAGAAGSFAAWRALANPPAQALRL